MPTTKLSTDYYTRLAPRRGSEPPPKRGEPEKIQKIHYSKFEVSVSDAKRMALVVAVAGVALFAIGLTILLTQHVNSSLFFLGGGEAIAGGLLFAASLGFHKVSKLAHQRSQLPFVKTFKEYETLLEDESEVTTVYRDSEAFPNLKEIYPSGSEGFNPTLLVEAGKDVTRAVHAINGKIIRLDETEIAAAKERAARERKTIALDSAELEALKEDLTQKTQMEWGVDKFQYAGQALLFELLALLRARYTNTEVGVDVGLREKKGTTNADDLATFYNLKADGKVLEIEVLFSLRKLPSGFDDGMVLKNIRGKIHVDFETGETVFSWSGPQDERQSFNFPKIC